MVVADEVLWCTAVHDPEQEDDTLPRFYERNGFRRVGEHRRIGFRELENGEQVRLNVLVFELVLS